MPNRAGRTLTLAALSVILAGCAMSANPHRALLSRGDPPSRPSAVSVETPCAEALSPAREVIAARAYPADLNLAEMDILDATLKEAAVRCTRADLDAFTRDELGVWSAPIAPTFSSSRPAKVSSRCARALEPWRAELAGLGSLERRDASRLAQRLTQRLAMTACRDTEQRLVLLAELEPALRRAHLAPRKHSLAAPGRR